MTSFGVFNPRWIRSSSSARQAASLSPLMLLIASRTFCPSCLTPSATRSEIEVAFLSSRTRTTVPSRMRRMIGSAASERAFQASPVEGSTDYILADRPGESRFRRAAHSARVGPGKLSTGDQGVGRLRAALIRPQRFALPLARAVLTLDCDRREQAHAVAGSGCSTGVSPRLPEVRPA